MQFLRAQTRRTPTLNMENFKHMQITATTMAFVASTQHRLNLDIELFVRQQL